MNRFKTIMLLSFLAAATSSVAETLQYATENGAIDGYDPVAYFTDGQAERGSPDITAEWNDAIWRFTSAEHRNAFTENPEKYAPQYGGFCALGMAHGGDVPTNPRSLDDLGRQALPQHDQRGIDYLALQPGQIN